MSANQLMESVGWNFKKTKQPADGWPDMANVWSPLCMVCIVINTAGGSGIKFHPLIP